MTDDEPPVDLYWATGCTSCLRAKEFLERNDVPFVSHNLAEDRGILDEMGEQGLPQQVPIVKRGSDWVDGQHLDDVARIAGVEYEAEPLPMEELYRRLEVILDAVEAYAGQVPDEALGNTFTDRPRTIGELIYHTFSIPEMFLEHEAGIPLEGYKPEPEWANGSTDALVTYGRHVRTRLRDWYNGAGSDRDWSATADVYYGEPTVHEFFERTTWHTGQHARQVRWILERQLDVEPDPLGAELWEGLPIPEPVWSEEGGSGGIADADAENILDAIQSS